MKLYNGKFGVDVVATSLGTIFCHQGTRNPAQAYSTYKFEQHAVVCVRRVSEEYEFSVKISKSS
jgi:hypothetical protein